MKKIFPIITFLLLASFLLPSLVQAAYIPVPIVPCGTKLNPEPCTLCHLVVGIQRLINYGTFILIIVAVTAIVIAGVIYIASAGSQKMMEQAKSFMLSAVLGFAFFLGAWLIISITLNIIGARADIRTGWNTFEKCDTTSSAPTSTSPASTPPASTPPTTPE